MLKDKYKKETKDLSLEVLGGELLNGVPVSLNKFVLVFIFKCRNKNDVQG